MVNSSSLRADPLPDRNGESHHRVSHQQLLARRGRTHGGSRDEGAYRFDPGRFASLRVPTPLPAGADSPPDLAASTVALVAALPGVHVVTMAGQGHVAMLTGPDLFVTEVLGFLRASGS